jgi:LytS/YehU family sensor histidine kinase
MLNTFEKNWIYIALVFLIVVLVSLFLWPVITQPLVWILIVIVTSMAITFSARKRIQAYSQKHIDRPALILSIGLDIARIIITILFAVLLAGKAGEYFGLKVGGAVETIRPGLGLLAGILTGLLTGLIVGLGVAGLVQWIFDLLTRLSLGEPIHSTPEINRR